MAQIRRPRASGVKSAFQNVAPATGGAFRLLAEAANTAYDTILPVEVDKANKAATEEFRNLAKDQIGENPVYTPGSKLKTPGQQIADDTMKALGKPSSVSDSLSRTESGGNYSVVNSEGFTGKYQWGQGRLDDYNRANGTSYTLAQFRASPQVQETAQAWHEGDILANLGQYVGRTAGGIQMTEGAIIGMAHLGGIGGAKRFIESDGGYDPADSNGTNLSDYARTHGGAGVSPTGTGVEGEPFTPTMLRTSDGKLESRLYSPYSGPVGQAYNAAAGVAYQSELMLKGQADLMGLSQQFQMDPDGFNEAAQSYVDGIMEDVPDMFRADVRGTLDTEIKRRALGMLEEKHRDISTRANNSSRAVAEMQGDQLAAAIAGGDAKEIASARQQLEGTLIARESLPGASWTREQSSQSIREAEAKGQTQIKKVQDEQKKTYKSQLGTVIDAAKAGLSSAYEGLLSNPSVQAMLPDEWREAAANVALRDNLPSLGAGTPAQVQAAVDELASEPVTDDFQVAMIKTAKEFASDHAKAFDTDPMAAATKYLPEKPPALPDLSNPDPAAIGGALTARVDYARGLVEDGYTERLTVLSADEAKLMGAIFAPETPPEVKAEIAVAITEAIGPDAAAFFKQIDAASPIIGHLGMMGAVGGSSEVVKEGFVGAELLRTGQATKPTNAKSVGEISPTIATALVNANGYRGAVGESVMESAIAIAAARSPQTADPNSEAAKAVMEAALQSALGQNNHLGRTSGGVQDIAGKPTLLPPTMVGEDLDGALSQAFGVAAGQPAVRPLVLGRFAASTAPKEVPVANTLWQRAGGSVPLLKGLPIKSSDLSYATLIPINGNRYMLSFSVNGKPIDAHTVDNRPYIFDAQALVDQARVDRQATEAKRRANLTVGMEMDPQVYRDAADAEVQVPQP